MFPLKTDQSVSQIVVTTKKGMERGRGGGGGGGEGVFSCSSEVPTHYHYHGFYTAHGHSC